MKGRCKMSAINYDDFILELKEEFKKTIPNDEKKLADSFETYMKIGLDGIRNYKFIKNDEQSIKEYLKEMANSLKKLDLDSKKRELIVDEKFEEISRISNEAFQLAQSIVTGKNTIINIDIEESIKKLNEILNSVEPHNKERAKKLVSEGILDLKYISNSNNGITSLRLGHYINSNNIKDEGER